MSERTSTTISESEQRLFRLGGGAAIAGALLGLVGNLVHPATPIGDPEGVARSIAESAIWVPDHLAIVLGLIFMLGGLAALDRSITGGLAGALARLGFAAAVAGITVGLILVTLDGLAARWLAEAWATAPPAEKPAALRLVLAEEALNFALASLFNVLFAGVTFILFGLAVALSRAYPRWLGWPVVIAGIGSVGAGLIQAYAGEPTPTTRLLTIIMPTIITLWLLVMGIVLVRQGAGARSAAPNRMPPVHQATARHQADERS